MGKRLLLLLTVLILSLAACSGGDRDGAAVESDDTEEEKSEESVDKLVFADAGWNSIRVHNSIAQKIIEEGYGIDTEVKPGSSAALLQGLREGDIDVYMEIWIENSREVYEEGIESGDFERLSVNFDDNEQALYVPTYVIEGDEERGIEPMAPDLETVEDLKDYPELFEDEANPGVGRLINAPSGWDIEEDITRKFKGYGLDENFENFKPGSDAAIVASLTDAYEAGEPWVGYYWSPTAVTAKYDLTKLEEPEYDEEEFKETGKTEIPSNDVVVVVNGDVPDAAPDVVDFLSNYETSSDLTEEALNYIEENEEAEAEEAAIWWMKEHEDLWTSWVPDDIAEKVKESLE